MNPLLEAALSYVRWGWHVLPLHSIRNGHCTCGSQDCRSPGKHPRTLNGVYDATNDPGVIIGRRRIWADANVGIATGGVSGFIVLDVDPRHGGEDTLADLEQQHGQLPETIEALTGGGGRHVLFGYPGHTVPNKVGIAVGLDVRGDGGLIVAPPSVHLTGRRYAWDASHHPEAIALAPAPRWLLALLRDQGGRLCRDGTPLLLHKGERNDTVFRLGCLMRRYGLCEAAIVESLLAIDRHHCRPPLGDGEIRDIAKSTARYPVGSFPGRPRRASRVTVSVEVA